MSIRKDNIKIGYSEATCIDEEGFFMIIEKSDLRCTLGFANTSYFALKDVLEFYYSKIDNEEVVYASDVCDFLDNYRYQRKLGRDGLGFKLSVHDGGFGIMAGAVVYINNEDGRDYLKVLKEALEGVSER